MNPTFANLDAWWRAANYLSVGQIYLKDNPLLREPLTLAHIKPRLLGHWGTTPGLNFIYAHGNRVIVERDLNMMYIIGPGHGGPGLVASTYLEGSYTEIYPHIGWDAEGMRLLFRQFSWPYGIPSHVAPETPGSIHEGGELGYALLHAYGAAFDNPDLVVLCVVGDGEAETGACATSWHSNKFLDRKRDGVVLPILHLNGYKIANPTFLDRIPRAELMELFRGYGYAPVLVEGSDPAQMHEQMARAMDEALDEIARIKASDDTERPRWPMIILRSPKGWTGPKFVDGKPTENTWRSHQVPFAEMATKPEHVTLLEEWMRSYRPEELFDATGRPIQAILDLAPQGKRRMGMNPHANGGYLLHELPRPDLQAYAVTVNAPGAKDAESTRVLGTYLRDVMASTESTRNFRVFGPDETQSNRLGAVLEVTEKEWEGEIKAVDERLGTGGRVMEVLSEHMCQGWLEGYLLTGRHGFFSCYEAFIHIIDSMMNQHAKWLKTTREMKWRPPIASLNYLLTSHVWRQDHNGFSHQDPGFLDHVVNKKSEVIRVYLPPDANTLLAVGEHCLQSKHYVNVIVAGKQPAPQWLTMEEATRHCAAGMGIWEWASDADKPDVVMACCGDVPTLETLAAVSYLRKLAPEVRIRVVNVVDLMALQPATEHSHGWTDEAYDGLFPPDTPVIFAFHGYPWLIHRLAYRRHNHQHLHVRGYKEEGTTTTPFDMTVLNNLDRFQLARDVLKRIGRSDHAANLPLEDKLRQHEQYIRAYGEDMPEIKNWRWGA
jgi:xylulose-5-phosphate/fructose-6-phosphate phosphoketolase